MLVQDAPAKVNLYLHVTGRRADGYHLLDSLMVFAGVGDRLTFAPADGLHLSMDGPGAAVLAADMDDNIVLRAARHLAQQAGIAANAAIHLTKVLPTASGIGGGSADAAATLRGLCDLWSLSVPPDDLHALALGLGADVPVCLASRPMLVSGVGECLTPSPILPDAALVLVNPRSPLSTPAVFRARQGDFAAANPLTTQADDAAHLARLLIQRHNGLTQAAQSLCPIIATILATLSHSPDCLLARMSGSGATCFGLFPTLTTAQTAAQAILRQYPDWWIAAAPLRA